MRPVPVTGHFGLLKSRRPGRRSDQHACGSGSAIVSPDEQNADVLAGMAIGGGLLVVSAANVLTAFGS